MAGFGLPSKSAPIRFLLISDTFASGTMRSTEVRNGELIRIDGDLTAPEPGRFFFQKQTLPGKAGEFAGVVEFPGSKTAYRIEPTGPGGTAELVARKLDEVICLMMPRLTDAAQDALDSEEVPPLDPQDVPDLVPAYNDGILSLQSNPGSAAVLYIDYRGGYTATWGGITYEKPNVSNAQIKDVWKRVCEDYMSFNINVTTDSKVFENTAENSRQRCIVTPTTTAAPSAGGVAYLNSWNWTGDTPCWAFYSTGKSAAEVIAHEVGHTLSLGHDGRTTPSEGYFAGQGSGDTGWAPIMGVGYYQPVTQWSKGEYQYANNTEDDLAKIVGNNNSVTTRVDDTGATLASARYLDIDTNGTVLAEGVIETSGDTDAFRFTTTGGTVSLTAVPVGAWADLATLVTLADSSDTVIASNSPQTTLWACITTNVTAGTYTFRVTGTGRNDALTNGFSAYSSLGYYTVTGSVANARLSTCFSVYENSTNGTVVGPIPPAEATSDTLIYTITSGNTSGVFSVSSDGTLKVANSSILNYESLASNTQYTVGFELFVTISNTVTPSLTETDRRVVVHVLDVDEAPAATGFDAILLSHTQINTVVGEVSGYDPDFYSYVTYAITAGNPDNAFSINNGTGVITVAADFGVATQTVYTLTVRVTDNDAAALTNDATVRITVVPNGTGFNPGSISYAVYDNIGSGTYVSNLTLSARFPIDPAFETQLSTFEAPTDRGSYFGAAVCGYVIPPISGSYTFWIASDDSSELWLSATTNAAAMSRIAYVTGYTAPQKWTTYSSQKSAAQTLVAGQAYYVEARMKEGSGNDNLAVAWKGPVTDNRTNVISGLYLAPAFINYLPHPSGFTHSIRRDLQAGAKVGHITVADVNSQDVSTLSIADGNGNGLFTVGTDNWVRVANDADLPTAASPVTLTIRATDNGTPVLSNTSSVQIALLDVGAFGVSSAVREIFTNAGSGNAVSDLTNNVKYPKRPDVLEVLTNFSAVVNRGDYYGSRIRAFVTPPASGDYRFFIASDDYSQLLFSRTTNAADAKMIAYLNGWVNANVFAQYISQISALQTNLVAGQRYYIEALQKEGSGGDNLSVAWAGPGLTGTNVIEGSYLEPLDINFAPVSSNLAVRVGYATASDTLIGRVAATDSPLDAVSFKIIEGNNGSTFRIDPDTGGLTLANTALIRNQSQTYFPLTVHVQDSGYGGLYPVHGTSVVITVTVVGPPTVSAIIADTSEWRVTWNSTLGLRYQIQSTTNLSDAVWTNMGDSIMGTGAPLTNAIPIGNDSSKFFRLLLLE